MLEQIPFIPDVDIAVNVDDEPHIFVPWDQMKSYTAKASESKHTKPPTEMHIVSDYSAYDPIPELPTFKFFPDYPSEPSLWLLARDTCQENSSARTFEQDTDFTTPAQFPFVNSSATTSGFVSNWTAAKSVCENPHLSNLQGYFINPAMKSYAHWNTNSTDRLTTRTLFPLFSACKLASVNNDILIPSAIYWGGSSYTAADDSHWEKKLDKAFWRGSATGQFNNETNWTRFHRHRFVSMMNGTQVAMTEEASRRFLIPPDHVPGGNPPLPYNIPMPNASVYPLGAISTEGELGRWVESFSDGQFVTLVCWPLESWFETKWKTCWYTSDWYTTTERVPMSSFFKNKYLPDIDGHSYSGRWEAFIKSDSLPMKATIFSEWHGGRLLAWRHFVPMDNTMMDWYGLMEYFLGYSPPRGVKAAFKKGHDKVAQDIAQHGQDWAEKVLRQDDILLYTWRLILEYARVCDDRREQMGFIDDLRQ